MHDAILIGIGTALNDDPQLNSMWHRRGRCATSDIHKLDISLPEIQTQPTRSTKTLITSRDPSFSIQSCGLDRSANS